MAQHAWADNKGAAGPPGPVPQQAQQQQPGPGAMVQAEQPQGQQAQGGPISLSLQAELELELSLRGSLLVQQQRRIVQLEDELQRAWQEIERLRAKITTVERERQRCEDDTSKQAARARAAHPLAARARISPTPRHRALHTQGRSSPAAAILDPGGAPKVHRGGGQVRLERRQEHRSVRGHSHPHASAHARAEALPPSAEGDVRRGAAPAAALWPHR